MCLEKYHQCGRRSSATSSPSLSSFCGYGTSQMLGPSLRRYGRTSPDEKRRLVAVAGIVGVEVLGHEEAPARSASGNRSTSASCSGPWFVDEQMRELVDEHVVEHPRGERREPRRHADRCRPREYTSPNAGADGPTTGPSSGRGQTVLAGQSARARRDVDARRVDAPAHALGQLLSRLLRISQRHPARKRHP